MSAGMAHQPAVSVVGTPVGARWVMSCPACPGLATPPMSKQGAELAQERHEWETEQGESSGAVSAGGRRRGRAV